MTSSKNKLQEYYQKKSLPLPNYDTTKIVDQYVPTWECKLTIENKIFFGYDSKKTGAEIKAAELALDYLTSLKRSVVCTKSSTIILIDIENCPTIFFELFDFKLDVKIVGFLSKNHPLNKKVVDYSEFIVRVPSTRKDAADVGMILYIGQHIDKYDEFIIVTYDHFADSVADCLADRKKCTVCTSISDILERIR
jgi:hypothetical protein